MSKNEEKPEQKSPPKTEIKKGSGELADKDLDKVGGGSDAGVESITLVHEGVVRR